MQIQVRSVRWLRAAARVCGAVAVLVGIVALIGWFTGIRRLASIRAGYIPMAPNTAIGFIITGIALLPLSSHTARRAARVWIGGTYVIALLALLTLIEYATPLETGVDQWIFHFPAEKLGLAPVGRMALFTAIGFVYLAISIIAMKFASRHVLIEVVARVLAVIVGIGGFTFAMGYLYGRPLYGGQQIPMALNTASCFFLLGLGLSLLGIAGDIANRRRAAAALAESERQYRVVVQQAADGITLVDAETLRIVEVNRAFENLVGYSRQELIGQPISKFIVDTEQGVAQRAQQTLGSAAPIIVQRQYRRRDGSAVDVEKSASVLELGGRRVMCTVIHDMTERLRAEAALRQSEARTRQIVEAAQDAFVSMDARGIITGWNARAQETFGWSRQEAIGRVLADTIVPQRYRQAHTVGLATFLKTGQGPVLNQRIEITALHRDGHEFPVELSISPLQDGQTFTFNAFVHDITERKRAQDLLEDKNRQLEEAIASERDALTRLKEAQAALVQTEKLASLGQMVAGVAHEINNPLAFVSNNVAVLERDAAAMCELIKLYSESDAMLAERNPDLSARIKELSERIDLAYSLANMKDLTARSRDGLRRIQQIVKDLREFARLDRQGETHDADLNAGIESTVNIILGLAKKKRVTIDCQLGEIPRITCHPAKINQVVMNLLSNAIDACDEGGRVTVGTSSNGQSVSIQVSDTGKGIPPEIRQRIFDPFFTTKAPGAGTGLGLSISYGIIKDHGGRIDVQSELGEGTIFHVTLPAK